LTRQRRGETTLRAGLSGMDGNNGHRERQYQAADDQDRFSGKVQWYPNNLLLEALPE
jgi:hypothetical protein